MASSGNNLLLPEMIRVLLPDGQVAELKLETYLAGVVGTEMSPGAPIEALKVQAVASRTYAASAHRHPEVNADVCTTAHCQRWRRIDPTIAPEVFRAVSETWSVVATHDDKLIDAFYFEHCDGKTRNAEDVLTASLPYLRSVECQCGFVGMRGHGLGLCQRGVIVMARRGASSDQILRHYYRGVSITRAGRAEPPRQEAQPASPVKAPPRPRKPKRAPAEKKATPPRDETPATPATESAAPIAEQPVAPPPPKPAASPAAPKPAPAVIDEESTAALMKELETLKRLTQTTQREADSDSTVQPFPPGDSVAPSRVPLDFPTAPNIPATHAPQPAVSKSPAPSNDFDAAMILPRAPLAPEESAPPPPLVEQETPSQVARRVVIDHLPGERMIAGNLPRAEIGIVIEDVNGNKTVTFSGSAPQYGAGGFEVPVEADGRYFITLGTHSIEASVSGDTVFIHAQNLEMADDG